MLAILQPVKQLSSLKFKDNKLNKIKIWKLFLKNLEMKNKAHSMGGMLWKTN